MNGVTGGYRAINTSFIGLTDANGATTTNITNIYQGSAICYYDNNSEYGSHIFACTGIIGTQKTPLTINYNELDVTTPLYMTSTNGVDRIIGTSEIKLNSLGNTLTPDYSTNFASIYQNSNFTCYDNSIVENGTHNFISGVTGSTILTIAGTNISVGKQLNMQSADSNQRLISTSYLDLIDINYGSGYFSYLYQLDIDTYYSNYQNGGSHKFLCTGSGAINPLEITSTQLLVGKPINLQTNNITNGGTITASEFVATSDYRIKENIELLDETYSVDNLIPVHYNLKKSKEQTIGFIAHEVQEIYPYLVKGEKNGEEMQSINYNGIIPILVREIQQLKKELKDLKNNK